MNYLLDTNVLSELVKSKPDSKVLAWFQNIPNESLYLSVISIGEIRKGLETVQDSRRKEKLRMWLEHELLAWFGDHIKPIDLPVAECWGRLLATVKRPVPAMDSLIAATAIHFDLAVVTRNTQDFHYPALTIINPWLQ